MILKDKKPTIKAVRAMPLLLSISAVLNLTAAAFAQGSPVPGQSAGQPYNNYNTFQGQPVSALQSSSSSQAGGGSAPVPGAGHAAVAPTSRGPGQKYRDLPLTAESAKFKLDELRGQLAVSRPQEVADSIQELCEWLADAADAHYRMYLSFAKSEQTKSQANSEKQLNQRFSQLKREAQLLKADLLVKQLRAPEALAPLVEIVVADPRSTTGQEAYKRLVELGFSQSVPTATAETAATTVTTVTTAPVKVPAAQVVNKVQTSSQTLKPLH